MIPNSSPHVLGPGDGAPLTFVGISTRIKVRSEQTNGAWTLIESIVDPRFGGFKVHSHKRTTETFYVLEGTITFQLDGNPVEAQPGSLILVPPGVRHTYSNPSAVRARYLLLISPGGFEKFLEGLSAMMQSEPQWPPADPTRLEMLADKYDATVG
jgi:mannose-6-phosphate isomerase-like protein (cupin superfamily)